MLNDQLNTTIKYDIKPEIKPVSDISTTQELYYPVVIVTINDGFDLTIIGTVPLTREKAEEVANQMAKAEMHRIERAWAEFEKRFTNRFTGLISE